MRTQAAGSWVTQLLGSNWSVQDPVISLAPVLHPRSFPRVAGNTGHAYHIQLGNLLYFKRITLIRILLSHRYVRRVVLDLHHSLREIFLLISQEVYLTGQLASCYSSLMLDNSLAMYRSIPVIPLP